MTRRVVAWHTWEDQRGALQSPLLVALVADLHNGSFEDVLPTLRAADVILIVGDLVNRHRGSCKNALAFLEAAPDCAPTYMSLGNHERRYRDIDLFLNAVGKSKVTLLDNTVQRLREDVALGGFSSAWGEAVKESPVEELAAASEFRLLMCHHPEYYPRYVQGHGIDLTLSGHAHGGQVRLGGRGLYAPGQGLLPELTAGFYDEGRLFVSRGMTNSASAPRIHNPCELVMLLLVPRGTR